MATRRNISTSRSERIIAAALESIKAQKGTENAEKQSTSNIEANNYEFEVEVEDISPDISEYSPSSYSDSDEEESHPQKRNKKKILNLKTKRQDKTTTGTAETAISEAKTNQAKKMGNQVSELGEQQSINENISKSDIHEVDELTEIEASQFKGIQETSTTIDTPIEDEQDGMELELEGIIEPPTKTNKPRKRLRCPDEWARNVSKKRRERGESYVTSRKKLVPGVCMNIPCSEACRRKCSRHFSEKERLAIFRRYYQLETYERKRDFINSNTERITKKSTSKENSKRSFTVIYYLPENEEKIQVCKTMFLNTLGIRKGVVDIAMKKRTHEGTTEPDKRGRNIKKATSPDLLNSIRQHIESFAVVESHYCRSGTKRKYLSPSLNITIMYDMHKSWCLNKAINGASASIYIKIFTEEYNLGFHRPKKDQCRICMAHKKLGIDKEALVQSYESHIKTKNEARDEKKKDKEQAQRSDGSIVSINFDLQQVLLSPTDPTNNALFYKQRLKSFNFTVYDVCSKQGDCFMWSETEGKRGSCEIATCLYQYFQSLPATVNHISCFSDRCGGQNLNKFVAGMCLTAVLELPTIQTIDLKFLVVGHSEMECDSMHSAIMTEERRVGKVNWPSDRKTIAKSARRRGDKPYIVHSITHDDIIDWKAHVESNITVRNKDQDGKPVSWQKMCWLQFSKECPFIINFKEQFQEEFRILDCQKKTRNNKFSLTNKSLLYQSVLPISKEKFNDLNSLFKLNPPALESEYQSFYESLPVENPKTKTGSCRRQSYSEDGCDSD